MKDPVLKRKILTAFMRRMDRLWSKEDGEWDGDHLYGNCCVCNSSLLPVLKELGTPGRLVACEESAFDGTGLRRKGLAADHAFVLVEQGVSEPIIYDIWAWFYLQTAPMLTVAVAVKSGLYPERDKWEAARCHPDFEATTTKDWQDFFNEEVWPAAKKVRVSNAVEWDWMQSLQNK